MAEDSSEFRHLRRAIAKASGDREPPFRNICRFYAALSLDALPGAIRRRASLCSILPDYADDSL